ncbi:MAG: L,D-transpeptidase, partial [Bacteroidota bacterium]|nr:L,D-transpeptidase [Bacteroidota bacterium]
SSHGCIRMRHEDAKKLYESSELGTLVLASKEYTARTVAFAPPGLVNKKVYTKDEYKTMLASNLYNIIKGRYFLEDKEIFIVDPKVIPVSGVYVSYDMRIPDKQIIPRSYVSSIEKPDKVRVNRNDVILKDESSEELIKSVGDYTNKDKEQTSVPDEVVKKYFNNPIGVLPYFGPKR